MHEQQRVSVLGIAVDDVTLDEAVEQVATFIERGYPHQVLTLNPEFVMRARRNRAFRATLQTGDLVVPDGAGIMLAARLQGRPLRGRVPGVDLVEALAAEGARRGWRFFLLGAGPGVAERTARILQARYPGLIIASTFAGSPRPEDEERICAIIRSAQPDILLVAYGAPAQDLWIKRNQLRIGVPVAIGVGGTFDYLSGVVPRAPHWMRQLGLEWLYRLMRQPWRWRRMLVLPLFFILAAGEALKIRISRPR
ncbi:MAG: WecB/TagA/CpsF family glycosyl transferase [Herpetosiphonaceae bacterium]|nr:MAG: WecB/TagA/CpsF family glycosyl transferase [Herpetosiphonaceae bacterium]